MLKSVLYYLLLITTSLRFIDIIYLLAKDNTNLPVPVLVVTTAMILYGIVLIVKKSTGNVRLKQMLTFYLVQTGMIVFNLIYVAVNCPLRISITETLIVGSFLDILINFGIIYMCTKQIRGNYFQIPQHVAKGQMNG